MLTREKNKLDADLGGIRDMQRCRRPSGSSTPTRNTWPSEAIKLNIPVIAILDTNCDPTGRLPDPGQRRRHPLGCLHQGGRVRGRRGPAQARSA